MVLASNLVVGKTRVRDIDGFCGTIEYLGTVASAKNENEVYAGIAWDDPSRGKHDGSVISRRTKKLVRHFSCEGGSFVRLSKLDIGTPLDSSVVLEKYVGPDAPLVAPRNLLPHTARTSSGKEKPIEFLGELELRNHQRADILANVAFRNMGISSISATLSSFENIAELDLAGNLFCDWRILSDILRTFPQLAALSLASNRIGDIQKPPIHKNSCLRILNLHSCGIQSMTTVQALNDMFPALEKLCVACNDLSHMTSFESISGFKSLTRLDVSSCKLSSWADHVMRLSSLDSLETLLLCDNPIESIHTSEKRTDGEFSNLMNLNLSGLSLHEWKDLQGASSLPALRSLTLSNTPLTASMGASEARFMVIARFPDLDVVNSSLVSEKERSEAERRYVSQVTQELLLEGGELDREVFLAEKHPCYAPLAAKLQDEMKRQGHTDVVHAMSSYAMSITISSMAADSCQMQPICKRLPSSLPVGRLKALCARAFGLDAERQALYYRSEVRTGGY